MIAQEVEPIGGFASNAFSQPVFQGGTFITILVFMFAQDPIRGAAAMTLLPVQLILIPRLQRRINVLVRERVVTESSPADLAAGGQRRAATPPPVLTEGTRRGAKLGAEAEWAEWGGGRPPPCEGGGGLGPPPENRQAPSGRHI